MVQPAFRWYVRGFQGMVQMLEEMNTSGERMDPTTLMNLEQYLARLGAVVKAQKGDGDAPAAPPSHGRRGPR